MMATFHELCRDPWAGGGCKTGEEVRISSIPSRRSAMAGRSILRTIPGIAKINVPFQSAKGKNVKKCQFCSADPVVNLAKSNA
jgi:hypothetical protein